MDITAIDEKTIRRNCRFDSEILQFKTLHTAFPPLIFGLVSFILIVAAGTLYLYSTFQPKQKITPLKKVVKTLPTPTITFLNPKDVRIAILNGSGRVGEAGKLKETLESSKYTVLSVGNADSDIENTKITSKKTVPKDFFNTLLKTIGEQYVISSDSASLPESTASADITITIGTQRTTQ